MHQMEFYAKKRDNYCKRNGKIIEEKVAGKSWFTRAKDEDHCQSRAGERVSGGAAAGATFLRGHYLILETEKEEISLTSSL